MTTPFYPTPTGQPIKPVTPFYPTPTGQPIPTTPAKLPTTPINADIIGNTTPLPIPPTPTPTNYNSTLSGVTASLGASPGGLIPPPAPVTPPTTETPIPAPVKSLADTVKEMLGLTQAPVKTADEYAKAEADAGILEKRNLVNSLTNQINAITAESQAEQLKLSGQGRGIPTGILRGQEALISKQTAIKVLPLAAQLSAAQGDLSTATQHLDSYFKMVVSDAEAQNEYYNKIVTTAYSLFSDAEKTRLDEIKTQKATDVATMRDAVNNAQVYAKAALENNDSATVKSLTTLIPPDPNSATFQSDLQNYNSQVASIMLTAKPDALRAAQIASANRANQTKVNTQVVEVGGKKLLINSDTGATIKELSAGEAGGMTTQIATSQNNIQLIDTLSNDSYLKSAVGPSAIARVSLTDFVTGGKSNFIAGVEQLRSQLNLDKLIQAKAAGATFGALSDNELRVLANAATKLGSWAKKDKDGNVTGYQTSEGSFRTELDKINNFAKLDYLLKGGNPVEVGLQTMPDGTVWAINSDGTLTKIK